jgi:hypothetical protein
MGLYTKVLLEVPITKLLATRQSTLQSGLGLPNWEVFTEVLKILDSNCWVSLSRNKSQPYYINFD